MTEPKTHHLGNLKAYYTKKGRTWCVEEDGKLTKFKSIEAMVETYPDLLKVEPIQMSVDRRALARTNTTPVTLQEAARNADVLSKIVTCYYCAGNGTVAFMPCPNCGGVGKIKVSTRGL